VLSELGRRDILSVLLEAGPSLNGSAIAANLVDKFILFYAPKIAGHAKVPLAHFPSPDLLQLHQIQTQGVGPDLRIDAYPRPIRSK
jgi:diaminohydroxyphosphoribosylaminopyrimidine deaminase / 5-amino-6-(5-phosphoribosylamino)uracil reductase